MFDFMVILGYAFIEKTAVVKEIYLVASTQK